MAYVDTQTDPNAQPNAQTNPMAQAPVTTSSGGVGTTAANAAPVGSPQGAAAVPTSTQAPPVQNLQAYLQANQPQAVQMGNTIAGNLQNTVNKTTGDINAAQTDLAGQVAAQNTAPNTDLVNQAAANPAQFVQNPQNLTDFLAQENANYGGPANFAATPYAQNLQNEVTSAVNSAPDINKPGGVEQLVTGQEQNPTLGMRNLDTLLLQGTPEAMAPIQNVIPKFGQLQGQYGNAQTSTDAAIQQAIANDQAAKAGVNTTFLTGPNAVVPTYEQNIKNEQTAAQTAQDKENALINALNQDINAKTATTPDFYNLVGAGGPLLSSMQNTPNAPSIYDYITPGQTITKAPTLNDVITPEQYDNILALAQLLPGQDFSQFGPPSGTYTGKGVMPTTDLTKLAQANNTAQINNPAQPKTTGPTGGATTTPTPQPTLSDSYTAPATNAGNTAPTSSQINQTLPGVGNTIDAIGQTGSEMLNLVDLGKNLINNPGQTLTDYLKNIGTVAQTPVDAATGVIKDIGNTVGDAYQNILGNTDHGPTAQQQWDQQYGQFAQSMNKYLPPDQQITGSNYVIPPAGSMSSVLRNELINGFTANTGPNTPDMKPTTALPSGPGQTTGGITNQEIYNAYQSDIANLTQPQKDWMAAYAKANPPTQTTTTPNNTAKTFHGF
jgi:hypothetical protein